jgi:hypothetical protein
VELSENFIRPALGLLTGTIAIVVRMGSFIPFAPLQPCWKFHS